MKLFLRINILTFFIFFLLKEGYCEDQDSIELPMGTVKGRIVSSRTMQPVPGATVRISDTKLGAYSDNNGYFKIMKVPVGRYIIRVTSVGYEGTAVNVVVTSGKELQMNLELTEKYTSTDTVAVTGEKDRLRGSNENALVSASVFSKEDVERFAGSRMDPARMAQNFAGVLGANDLRNDIIIRGGSPTELLWRLDGLDVPNPNHFATQGATGGPISAINSTTLAQSDFLTGAFPAEYGDKMSGVFDLKTRKGNMERYEFIGQFGFNGFEFGGEGPLPGVKGSFIANYRYSFLDLLDKMGFKFGFAGIPRYQDAFLKVDLAGDEKNILSLTGLGGISNIDIKQSKTDSVFTGDMDIRNATDLGAVGINWTHLFSDKLYGRLTAGWVYERYSAYLDSITTDDNHHVISMDKWLESNSGEGYYTVKYGLFYAPDNRNFLSVGLEPRLIYYNLNMQRMTIGWSNRSEPWKEIETGTSMFMSGFINWNWRITEEITSNIGFHSQYLDITGKTSIEPRMSVSYRFLPLHSFNLGFGVHRQSLPLLLIFSTQNNKKLDFMQALHYVAGYTWQAAEDALIKIEGYYKDITKAAVDGDKISSASFLNEGASFGVVNGSGRELANTGKGRTYGAEFSFIKNFSDHYYITATASYVRQQYTGSDGIWRYGAFDNRYILNLLAGYEWILSPGFTIEFSGKYTTAGGAPYTPVDTALSFIRKGTNLLDEQAFSMRNDPYSRFDLRIDFRNNFQSFSITSYVSAENIFNTQNIYLRQYNVHQRTVQEVYQMGFFFVGGFRIEF